MLSSINAGETRTFGFPFKFTGEMVDANDLVYLRARYYHPGLGVFPSLDPVEGNVAQAISLNRYGYVAGNVVNRIDPSGHINEDLGGWDPCQEEDDECEGSKTFTYNRMAAAQAAIDLSRQGRQYPGSGLDDSRYATQSGTSSARFISLALYKGGFPMTNDPTLGENPGVAANLRNSDIGWRAGCDENTPRQIEGNIVWRVHDRLVEYLTGSRDVGADFDPANLNPSNRLPGRVSIAYLFSQYEEKTSDKSLGNRSLDRMPIPERLEEVMREYATIDVGDYVFGTLPYPTSSGDIGVHGFMVVGRGPAVSCNNSSIDYTDPNNIAVPEFPGKSGDSYSWGPSINPIINAPVFYVADVFGAQRGTPRPFYCSVLDDSPGSGGLGGPLGFFDITHWEFYRIPNQVVVPCNRQYDPGIDVFSGSCSGR